MFSQQIWKRQGDPEKKEANFTIFLFVPRRPRRLDSPEEGIYTFSQQIGKRQGDPEQKESAPNLTFFFGASPSPV